MKIQNLFSTGKMNKDVDERLIQNGEYVDALNVRVLNTAGGDSGAIENEKGNVRLTSIGISNSPECIGSVANESKEKIYWFVVNELGYSYIYEYDRNNDITSNILTDERSGDNQVLKFSKDYKITGVNVIFNNSKKSNLILWTDGLNQPRMIDIQRAKSYGLNNFYEDDISLYKKPPRKAPDVTPFNSLVTSENAVRENFFAFGYRYRYLDGGYSASSSFSYFQFTPEDFSVDFASMENKGMLNIFNGYRVKYDSGDHRVTDVQLLFKYPTEPTIYVIDSINKKESSIPNNSSQTYEFINKKIYKTLPQDEVFRVFDDVPLTAKSQDFINDRIVFGNTTSQYDVVEQEGSNDKIKIDYTVDLISTDQEGDQKDGTLSTGDTKITFDFTGEDLLQGYTITANFSIASDAAGTSPNIYFNGRAVCQSAFVLSQDYATVSDMVQSAEFISFLGSVSSVFSSVVNTTSPINTSLVTYGSFTLDTSTSTSFTILAPSITHQVDTTPLDTTDNVFTNELENFEFEDGSNVKIRESVSNISLKSLRSYEVGLVYLDEYGRYSSILLPKESIGTTSNEVFVPVANSVNLNKLRLSLSNKPPYWADRYKYFVKVNKDSHYNIYATIFYEDGLYRWVLLQGNNLGKVEAGQTLIVKADDTGPLSKEIKCKVLDVTTKNGADEEIDGEGWIPGNQDGIGEPLVERAGTYMKIRPNGFQMDFNPNNFIEYRTKRRAGGGFLNTWSGTNTVYLPKGPHLGINGITLLANGLLNEGILQRLNPADNTWVNQDLTTGSSIKLELVYSESDGDPNFNYFKEWTSNGDYVSTATDNAFGLFLKNETDFTYESVTVSGGTNGTRFIIPSLTTQGENFKLDIYKTSAGYGALGRWMIRVQPSEGTATFENSTLEANIDIVLVTTLAIFETEPVDLDADIYYETEETFEISNGLHKGNFQDQTSTLPAVSNLGFGNCFSFGNGVESMRVLDDRFKAKIDVKSRPNIAIIEGYERKEDKTKLIYSGSFNENTGYNTLNEFNSSRGITKYMDSKYGSIQKIFARESDLVIFQEDRVSKVLYGKNILSSPDGSGSLSQIEKVLGQDVPFSGEYGISLNPESFSNYEGRLYFADPNRGAVLRLGNDGITPISYLGMKAFFKDKLYNNKSYYNVGGYDPKYHQYVLSMGNDQVPQDSLELDCASSFTRAITSANSFLYDLNVGSFSGVTTIGYTTSSSINIVIVYNGVTYTNNNLTGTGQVTFNVTSSDLDVTNIASVSISSSADATVSITHTCPVPDTLEVVLVVVNDSTEAAETIINRYKHDGAQGNIYNSDLDIFEADELTRYEVITGYEGTDIIPDNGDNITISSLKQIGTHSGSFNVCNSLGYLVSAASGLSVQNIIDQATYPTVTNSTTSSVEENTINFEFNRTNTSQKLYLVWNYIDSLPVLTDDSVTGITNGGSSIINVVANDSIPSPYTLSIGTQPSHGTAVVNANNTITYNHTEGNNLNDSFTYVVSRGGGCQATATVTTQALAISVDTYIYIYFDDSGSMATTESELQTLRTGALKGTLQDLYATAGTESSGNTNNATNGSDEYDSKVTIVYGAGSSGSWQNERTFAALGDNDVNDFISTSTHNDFPSDASNVIVIVFQDESSPYDASGSGSTAPSRTATYDTDIADLRSRVTSLNSSNSGFYRGILMEVQGYTQFNAFIDAVIGGTGNYSGTNGLSDLVSGSSPTFNFVQNVEESDNNDANAPLKPVPYTGNFDQWQYYYLYLITDSLNTLGFSPSPGAWPIVIDD